MLRWKLIPFGLLVTAVAAVVLWWRLSSPDGGRVPAQGGVAFPAERFERVPVTEDRVTLAERLRPGRRRTRAEELLEGLPAGSEAYEVETAAGDVALIYRSPSGEIYTPRGSGDNVRAYRRARPLAALEFRPAVVAFTDLTSAGAGVALGVGRLGRVHLGPAACYDSRRALSLGAAATANVWRNVDIGGYAGKAIGAAGWRGGVAVAVALE